MKGQTMQTTSRIEEQLALDAQRARRAGVAFNPKLPRNFDSTPNDARPASHRKWWNRPYISTQTGDDPHWLNAWPSGIRYDVRCLDGGAWDRSTGWGMFATLDEALQLIANRVPS
jgi:hypothetical protein